MKPIDHATKPGADAIDKRASVRWLMALNFTIADVQNGMGPYVALFLQSASQWNPAQIGTALALGNVAQVLAQTPAGALIDQLHQKRALLVAGLLMIAVALSNAVAGALAQGVGVKPTFLVLAAIAAVGFAVFALFMPETRDMAREAPAAVPAAGAAA